MKTFLKSLNHIKYKVKQLTLVFIDEYDVKVKLIRLINLLITGLLLHFMIIQFSSSEFELRGYIGTLFLIILFEHYFPWIVKEIKRKTW